MIGFGTLSEFARDVLPLLVDEVGAVLLVFWAVLVEALEAVVVVVLLLPEVTSGPTKQAFIMFSTFTHLCTCMTESVETLLNVLILC